MNVRPLVVNRSTLHRPLLLVLAPMVALAVFGWLSLRRDQSEVEREARERASSSARLLMSGVEREWAVRWPEVLESLGGTNAVVLRVRFDGLLRLVEPVEASVVPEPPAWTRTLPAKLWQSLEALRTAEIQGPTNAVASLALRIESEATNHPALRATAELARLRLASPDRADAAVRIQALGLRALAAQWVDERGVPVAASAAVWLGVNAPEMLRGPRGIELLRGLVHEQPSLLTSWILARARTNSASPELVRLQAEWQTAEVCRALAGAFRAASANAGGTSGPAWLRLGTNQWRMRRGFRESGMEVEFLERATIARGVDAMRSRLGPPDWPPGMESEFELAGELMEAAHVSGSERPRASSGGDLVTQLEGTLAGVFGAGGGEGGVGLKLRVRLVEPQKLFAAQRRQQRLFTGLLLGVVGVAGIGLWQTRRAFLRQMALNQEKTNFVSSVSHELRAPLASMRLLAEGLAEGRAEEPAKRREYAGFLVQETRRLGSLVENVLDFSRIEQGRKEYRFEPVDLLRLTRETVRIPSAVAAERDVRLEFRCAEAAVEIWADAPSLQQALLNLIDNALKHAPAGTAVEVELRRTPDRPLPVTIAVRDAGPGIPPEEHDRIFERFYRRGSELRRETQGVGLGLSLVRHTMEAHGGRVRVESRPGQGATFTLELPLRPPGVQHAEKSSS